MIKTKKKQLCLKLVGSSGVDLYLKVGGDDAIAIVKNVDAVCRSVRGS